jgi:outer membrane cobalamin receptor
VDSGVEWKIAGGLTASAGWLWTRSEVRRCSAQRSLEGRALPQVPAQQASLHLKGDYTSWRWDIDGRWAGCQFDDDANQLRLRAYATLDLRVTCKLRRSTEVFASLENATDSEIQTRRDANGTIAIGAPRMWSLGIRREF